jgi:hypothetical protein
VKNGAVVEAIFALGVTGGMRPLALALGELDEVGDGFGSVFLKQAADDGAFGCIEDGVSTGLAGYGKPLFVVAR